ncbi:hypothetical protein mRhiFer1_009446 [Rhinolophus ferrumequinum]|uniref:Uncharacterized protein n=1 Tax=Rhinolophus ferrumequinum TaxID=59479 RepID=A0A7J7RIY0_RHIFE|nr:hypothetical protein mRhiFer1_009446 [Rhinolophus ferrumequinum]
MGSMTMTRKIGIRATPSLPPRSSVPRPRAEQTVAPPQVRDPGLLSLHLPWSLLWTQRLENPHTWGGGGVCGGQRYLLTGTCSPVLPIAFYQQGFLSATILYEILLGKATLYAVLVSALVLMAMVKRKES